VQAVLRRAIDCQHFQNNSLQQHDTKRVDISHLVSRLSQLLPQQKRFEVTACVAAVLCSAGHSEHEARTAVA